MLYTKENLNQISFPLGGIGSGCIGLGGDGRLVDWEIFNRPSKGSLNGYSHFAIKAKKDGKVITKILNGDMTKNLIGKYGNKKFSGFGFGPETHSMCGFPHFKDLIFNGEFPIAQLDFKDDDFPYDVKMTSFNPFIPLDDKNSSIPGAFFSFDITNNSESETEIQVAFSVHNPFSSAENIHYNKNGINSITMKKADSTQTEKEYGDLTVATDCENTLWQTYWYRGGWQDSIVSFWNDFNNVEDIKDRQYDEKGNCDTCTLVAKVFLKPKETRKVKFVLTWNVPNCYNYWSPYKDENDNDILWKNYYAVLFENSYNSALYSLENWDNLYSRTLSFKEELFNSTLDNCVKDAISANLSVLKSPTVLRLSDGSFYGWEGVDTKDGSCEGTCQHVWNYAYALCFLFPKLERTIRNAELKYSLCEDGKTVFRLKLPYGRDRGDFRACLDGQMGTITKMYREWKICGDNAWLKENWNNIKNMLEYAWSEENPDKWDINKEGILKGRQHHTLDMELFGPSSWLEGMYLAALKAASEMAECLGDFEKQKEYYEIYLKGVDYTKENLFNGKYFIQKIDLSKKEILEKFDAVDSYWNEEKNEIKYQIKDGSIIDQMLGQWHADLVGLGDILDKEQVKTALKSMYQNNFKSSMRNFSNPWRIFSVNDEAGSVICDYPKGTFKPSIPIPYCEETMTGFEYQFAGLLASNGMINEAISVVKAIRDRYDGKKRNPWNEIECGSNYARSMASFALLPIFSGFTYDLPHEYIGFNPKISKENFRCFWSLETGWGGFECTEEKAVLTVTEGEITLSSFGLYNSTNIKSIMIDGINIDFDVEKDVIKFKKTCIGKSMEILL